MPVCFTGDHVVPCLTPFASLILSLLKCQPIRISVQKLNFDINIIRSEIVIKLFFNRNDFIYHIFFFFFNFTCHLNFCKI